MPKHGHRHHFPQRLVAASEISAEFGRIEL